MQAVGLILIGLVLAISSGCGSECGDLQDVCDTCQGANKALCEAVADADDGMACEGAVQQFETDCSTDD